jgi:flagellar hook-length control protein FliK
VKTQDAPRAAAKPASQSADPGAAGYKQPGTGSDAAGTPARPEAAAGQRPAAPAAAAQPQQQQQPAAQSGAAGSVNAPQHASAVTRGDAPLTTGVPLSRAAETVEHVLRLAATRGAMQARVSLKPAELGSLEVVIRQTAAGLTARVVADDAGAAQVLQQAGSELRRSLEQQGITLLNLDIGQSGDDRSLGRSSDGAREGGYEERGDAQTRSGGTVAAEDATSTETTVQLPNGALIDVLA